MTVTHQEDHESGLDETALTDSNTTYDLIAGTSPTFTDSPARDTLAALFANSYGVAQWTPSALGSGYMRCYAYLIADGGAMAYVGDARNIASGNRVANYRRNTNGTITVRDDTTASGAASTITWDVGEWCRFEWFVDQAGGAQELRIFKGASLEAPVDAAPIAGQIERMTGRSADTASGPINFFGIVNTTAAGQSFVIDDMAIGDDWIGPSVASDTTPPSTPTDVTLDQVQSTTATVSWTASTDDTDDPGDLIYRVYVDAVEHADSPTPAGQTELTLTGLTADTEYDITVTAEDTTGNESSPTTARTLWTQSADTAGSSVKVWDGTQWVS